MKAIFIVYNQALSDDILEALNKLNIRGFTKFDNLKGRGSKEGDPHMGSHTWPSLNNGALVIAEEENVEGLLAELRKINDHAPEEGLRAFVWEAESAV